LLDLSGMPMYYQEVKLLRLRSAVLLISRPRESLGSDGRAEGLEQAVGQPAFTA